MSRCTTLSGNESSLDPNAFAFSLIKFSIVFAHLPSVTLETVVSYYKKYNMNYSNRLKS